MSFDFALKELYRKRKVIIPYILTISLTISMVLFFIHFLSSYNLTIFISQQQAYENIYFFTGATFAMYSQFFSLIIILMFIVSIVIVLFISYSYINHKKKDISVMKALGTLPEKLYKFYLIETYLIFLFGFILGLISSLLFYFVFIEIMNFLNIAIIFQFNIFLTALLFLLSSVSCLILAGLSLRKLGKQELMQSFSEEIPSDYSPKPLTFIPKWLSSLGKNIKHSVVNSIRGKSRYKRYLFIFGVMGILLITLTLGAVVLDNTSRSWINKSQASQSNIIAIGHEDVVESYSDMYEMYSNPNIFVDDADILFTEEQYLFNFSQIQSIQTLDGVNQIEQRVINFSNIQEQQTHNIIDVDEYEVIGQNREAILPVIGVNLSTLIPDFEVIKGNFFTQENASNTLTISDGIANNLFEDPLVQEMSLTDVGKTFSISGVIFDTFYSGYASYIDLNEYKTLMGINGINLVLVKIDSEHLSQTLGEINNVLTTSLGNDFTYINLRSKFQKNLSFIDILTSYSVGLLIATGIISLFSIYQFQKGEMNEKLRDFLIMHAIGSKLKNIKRILFFEGLFVIVPAISIGLAGGLLLNLFFLFDRTIVQMPSISIPLIIYGLILLGFIIFNYLVVIPIIKKIKRFSIASMIRA